MTDTGAPVTNDSGVDLSALNTFFASGDEPAVDGQQQQQHQLDNSDTSQGNSAWNDLLAIIPEAFHSQVKPHLQNWDKGVQDRFTKVQTEYEPYKPFIEQGVTPESIHGALNALQAIEQDPNNFINMLREFYHLDEESGTDQGQEFDLSGDQQQQQYAGLESNPLIKQLQEQQAIIAQFLSGQINQQEQQQADQALDEQLDGLRKTYGEFDDQYVYGLAANGMDLEKAVQSYFGLVDKIRTTPRAGANHPAILSPGGSMPSESINPSELTPKDRRALVAQILAANNTE